MIYSIYWSKALRSAIAKKFGTDVHVHRCQQHKRRNVRDHLPHEHQEAIDARLRPEKKFKHVKGYREIPKLVTALQQKNLNKKEVAV